MSKLLGDVDIEFPETVQDCHAEIRRLSRLIAAADIAIDDLEDDLEEAQEEQAARDGETERAVHAFLDEIERTGPLRFVVPESDRTSRAIVDLHDVVGRRP